MTLPVISQKSSKRTSASALSSIGNALGKPEFIVQTIQQNVFHFMHIENVRLNHERIVLVVSVSSVAEELGFLIQLSQVKGD